MAIKTISHLHRFDDWSSYGTFHINLAVPYNAPPMTLFNGDNLTTKDK